MTDQYSDRQQDSIPPRYLASGDHNMNIESGNANEMNDENNDDNNEDYDYENDDSTGKKSGLDKKKRRFRPSGTSAVNQSGQLNKNSQPQNRNIKPGGKTAIHQSRYQTYYKNQSNEEEMEDDNEENIEDEDENEDDQDENYPLSPQQQAQYNRMQQQKFTGGKRDKSDGHISKMNTMNSNSSMSNLNQAVPANRNMHPVPQSLNQSLKNNPIKTNNMNMNSGHPGYPDNKNDKVDIWGHLLVGLSYFFLIFSFPFSLCACVKVAQEYERLGRTLTGGAKGPGIFFVLPCIDTYTKVDLRTVTFDVPPQEILTKDSVTVSVDAVVYFRIFNAVVSVINVEDAAKSTKLLAASTLRNILGTKSLHEILSDRESVAIMIQNNLDEATGPCTWNNKYVLFCLKKGVKVERVEVKDVRLPVQLQRAMATEAEAAREARAKVIAAEGEQKASKALKEAAEVISESPIAIQLRYLQTLTQIASEKNSTIVFPIPLEMLSFLANKSVGLFKQKS